MFRAIKQPLLDAPNILTDSQASTKTVGIALRKKVHAADILPKTKRSKRQEKLTKSNSFWQPSGDIY